MQVKRWVRAVRGERIGKGRWCLCGGGFRWWWIKKGVGRAFYTGRGVAEVIWLASVRATFDGWASGPEWLC